jgi:hypothetical protein
METKLFFVPLPRSLDASRACLVVRGLVWPSSGMKMVKDSIGVVPTDRRSGELEIICSDAMRRFKPAAAPQATSNVRHASPPCQRRTSLQRVRQFDCTRLTVECHRGCIVAPRTRSETKALSFKQHMHGSNTFVNDRRLADYARRSIVRISYRSSSSASAAKHFRHSREQRCVQCEYAKPAPCTVYH